VVSMPKTRPPYDEEFRREAVGLLARISKQRIGTWLGAQANWKRSCRPFHQGISIGGRSAVRMIGL